MNEIIQENNDEFSFRKFMDLLKRSGKRMLIYAIIAAVIGACLAAVIAVTTMEKREFRGTVEYTHNYIVDGLDPNGVTLNYNRIKSSSVINAALVNMGYSESEVSELSGKLEGNLIVEPYIPDAIAKQTEADATLVYHPSRYNIILIPDKEIGMSKAQYNAFVNELMKSYVEYFKTYYNYKVSAVVTIDSNAVATAVDYYDIIYAYNNEIEAMKATVNALPDNYMGVTNKLIARINVLASYVSDLENYILTHRVQKEGVSLGLESNLDNKIAEYTNLSNAYKTQSESLDEPISKYQQMFDSVVVGENKITISSADASAYNALVTEKKNAVKLQTLYESSSNSLTAKKALIPANYTCTTNDRAYVESRFNFLYSNFQSNIEVINQDLAYFADKEIMNNGVKIVSDAYTVQKVNYISAVVAFVVVMLAGIIASVTVTNAKEKKALKNAAATVLPAGEEKTAE